MGKITRAIGNLVAFASNATGTDRTVFGGVTQSDDLTANITTEFKEGWGIVGPSDKPALEDFNGAMFTHGQLLAYLHQMGVAEWDGGQEFQIGSISNRNGTLYSCKTADHVSATPPESDPVNWEKKISLSDFEMNQLSANGYQSFPGGLIIQWGSGAPAAAGSSQTVTLPTTYPNGQLFSIAAASGVSASAGVTISAIKTGNETVSSVDIFVDSSTVGSVTPKFFSVGW